MRGDSGLLSQRLRYVACTRPTHGTLPDTRTRMGECISVCGSGMKTASSTTDAEALFDLIDGTPLAVIPSWAPVW